MADNTRANSSYNNRRIQGVLQVRKIVSSQTVILYQGSGKPPQEALAKLGEEVLVSTLEMASLMFTGSNLPTRVMQAADDHYLFVQSSGLDYMIENFGMKYDPQGIRNTFQRYFK